MHLNGENLKYHLIDKSCRKWTIRLNINISEKEKLDPRCSYATIQGNIHVYYHNIQTCSPLKHLCQPKSNFIRIIYTKGEPNAHIKNPGHMTKNLSTSLLSTDYAS